MSSIRRRTGAMKVGRDSREVRDLFEAALVDLTTLQTHVASMRTWMTGDDLIISPTVLSISATPTELAVTACSYLINGVTYAAAADATLPLTDADTVNTAAAAPITWGAWIVQANAAGTWSTHGVDADQDYATEALAIAALPVADAGNVALGYFTVQTSGASTAWTGKTDDMTAASDCTAANFYSNTSDIPAAVALTLVA